MYKFLLLLIPAVLFAQPEVSADRHVTFKIAAPKASEVTFYGDWMPVNTSQKMTKGGDGVWTLTVGPLAPSIYLYTFTVDGVTIADPVNPYIKLRSRTSASMVEVPSEPPALWQAQDVPHGSVEINWQKSKVLGDTRWIWVYTPPGYSSDSGKRYPVLYLFHGSNDIAGGWTLAGNANFILDNLIAAKKAAPMIVVMPYGHAVPFGAPREQQAKNAKMFEDYLLTDVMPFAESKYRIAPGRPNHAIAGLSMGGGQSLMVGFKHPEMFSAVGAFSAAVPANMEEFLKDSAVHTFQTVWVACGKDDSLFERNQKLAELLNSHQVKTTFRPSEGAHTYTVWRMYLGEFAPLLFH